MKTLLSIALFFLLSLPALAGGGWTYQKNKGYIKLGQNMVLSDRYFSPEGEIIDITTIGYYATSVYGEYGITDKLTAIAYVPFFTRNTLNKTRFRFSGDEIPGDEMNSVGDIDLSLQYSLIKSDTWVMSARLLFGLPTGNPSGGETGILQSGDGEFNQMLRLDLSRPFSTSSWFSIYAGFNNRTMDFSDEYRLGGEIGTKLKDRFLIIGKLDIVQSFMNGNADPSMSGTLFSNNTEYISPAIELAYEFKGGFGISASAAGAFAGSNILAAPNYGLGLYYGF